MVKKQLAKRITTAVVAGLLSVMMVMPVMAKGEPDDGLMHPWGSESGTCEEALNYASTVTMDAAKYKNSYDLSVTFDYNGKYPDSYPKLLGLDSTEKVIKALGNSYKEGAKVEIVGMVTIEKTDGEAKNQELEFNVSGVKAGDNIKVIDRNWAAGYGVSDEDVINVYDTEVTDGKVVVTLDVVGNQKDVTAGGKVYKTILSNSITFVKMTSESQDSSEEVPDKSPELSEDDKQDGTGDKEVSDKLPEFSNDAKLVGADGKEVESKNVTTSTENLSESQIAEVKGKLATNNVVINDNSIVDYIDISLIDNSGNVVKLENGSVVITIPAKENVSADKYTVKVYHIKADGSMEEVPAELTSEGVKITATSFSPYVVVYSEKSADIAQESEKTDADIKTGDAHNALVYAIVAVVAVLAGGACVLVKTKRA